MMSKKILSSIVFLAIASFMACDSGELPTAVEQPQELHAPFVTVPPVLDGHGDDPAWQNARAYKVFVDNAIGSANLPPEGRLVELKAVWWKETVIDTATADTNEVIHIGFLASWPDNEKNLDRQMWRYNPADSMWSQQSNGSDWMLWTWLTAAKNTDIWFWDSAITNPMGYFDDMVIENFEAEEGLVPLLVGIDNLNTFNDTESSRNTWDRNYDDNLTPRELSDDRPRLAWKADPQVTAPALPPVFSDPSENVKFLLGSEAELLDDTPFAIPSAAVEIPGFVLEEPAGGSADIRAYGRHENGRWTVEFERTAVGSDESDVVFNPEARFFSQLFALAIGNDAPSPFDAGAAPLQISNMTLLTFQFVFEE